MEIFKPATDGFTPSRRFLQTTRAENDLLLGDDLASLITCIEDQALFSALRDDVHQHVAPASNSTWPIPSPKNSGARPATP
ncbi:MAG: hypothetical protein J0H49_31125 [Acidobacteria bacterium]|nr:hypothetical protein [Acidobacteriota bacterium]